MQKHNIFWGAFFILFGVLFMVDNLGILNLSVWSLVWPSFLIALGVWTIWATRPGQRVQEMENVMIPLDPAAARAEVRLRYGGGRLKLQGAAGPGEVISGGFAGGLDFDAGLQGDVMDLELRVPMPGSPVMFIPWVPGGRDWHFSLSDALPVTLDVKSGGSDTQLDLTDLQVTGLRVETGASATDIHVPAKAGYTRVRVNGGAASLNIRVPEGVAARIDLRGGLRSSTIDEQRFPRSGSIYESEDYGTAENKVDIQIELGLGAVDIR